MVKSMALQTAQVPFAKYTSHFFERLRQWNLRQWSFLLFSSGFVNSSGFPGNFVDFLIFPTGNRLSLAFYLRQ
jgi:hypothetical protein